MIPKMLHACCIILRPKHHCHFANIVRPQPLLPRSISPGADLKLIISTLECRSRSRSPLFTKVTLLTGWDCAEAKKGDESTIPRNEEGHCAADFLVHQVRNAVLPRSRYVLPLQLMQSVLHAPDASQLCGGQFLAPIWSWPFFPGIEGETWSLRCPAGWRLVARACVDW